MLVPGKVDEPTPGVRRILCNNPEPVHLQGHGELHHRPRQGRDRRSGSEDAAHSAALLDAVRGETVTQPSSSPTHSSRPFAGRARDQAGDRRAGAGRGPASRGAGATCRRRAEARRLQRHRLQPDRALADGEVVAGDGWTIEAITTPGHTANHMAFAFKRGQRGAVGRPRDGVVDAGGVAARRLDGRLHELAAEARQTY